MTSIQDTHLTYEDLLCTLVDNVDLDSSARAHLAACSRCQSEAERLAQRYKKMGRAAKDLAPSPSRTFRTPERRGARVHWQFKTAIAFGAAGVLVFVLTLWWPQTMDRPDAPPQRLAQTIEADNRLMAEIDALVENALPEGYQELAMITDSDITDLSEDLIDWIVPSIEDTREDSEPVG